ncbi:hypothetical protein R1flu_002101 [Riccia fluitans]|uniref:Trafficking protein particle complex subunit n=1 Tax=Riccia fluitans TaxID=41844 RepID=A0ABD1Y569_9MARC
MLQAPGGAVGSSTRMRCMYMFNRQGVCLHYHVWLRPVSVLSRQEDQKLMFGLLFSLKLFTAKMDPVGGSKGQLGAAQLQGQGCSFHSFQTNTYKLSFMETPTGLKIVLVTDSKMSDLREALKYIYSNIYVEYVVKNPLYTPDTPFKCELFNQNLDNYVKTLS